MNTPGMGRVRAGRFAAFTIPAAATTVGLGLAVVNGMVSATATSADGFHLTADSLHASTLTVRPGTAPGSSSSAEDNTGAVYLETTGATASHLSLTTTPVHIPGFGCFDLSLGSSSNAIQLGDVTLNAESLTSNGSSTLNDVEVGAVSTAGQSQVDAQDSDLTNLAATAYSASMPDLGLSGLSLGVDSASC